MCHFRRTEAGEVDAHAEKRWVWRKISNSSEGDKVSFNSPSEILSTVDTFVEKARRAIIYSRFRRINGHDEQKRHQLK